MSSSSQQHPTLVENENEQEKKAKLINFSLQNSNIDNTRFQQLLQLIASLDDSTKYIDVQLSNNDVGSNSIVDVGKLIDNCPRGMKCLSVDLSYNNWQAVSKFCENLHNLPKSTEILILNFGWNDIHNEHSKILIDQLLNIPKYVQYFAVRLRNNRLMLGNDKNATINQLFNVIPKETIEFVLDVSCNELTDNSLNNISDKFQFLPQKIKYIVLDLSDNAITDLGAPQICNIFGKLPKTIELFSLDL